MALMDQMGPAAEDDPRRRRSRGLGGYEGIGGPNIDISQMLPFLRGLGTYDYSGANVQDFAPQGLADILGPAGRHFMRQQQMGGGPEMFGQQPGAAGLPPGAFMGQGPQGQGPPGLDNRNAPGGQNIAPGNIDTGLALGQGQQPFAGGPMPQTQGWRNVAPGYSVAAGFGFGTPEFEQRLQGIGRTQGIGADIGGGRRGITGGAGLITPGAGTRGAPGAPGGGGGGGGAGTTGGGASAGGKQTAGGGAAPGGGGGAPKPGPGPAELSQAEKARGVGKKPGVQTQPAPGGGGTSADTNKRPGGPGLNAPPPDNSSGTSADTNKRPGANKERPNAGKPKPKPAPGGGGTSADTNKKVAPVSTAPTSGKTKPKPKPKVGSVTSTGYQTGGGF